MIKQSIEQILWKKSRYDIWFQVASILWIWSRVTIYLNKLIINSRQQNHHLLIIDSIKSFAVIKTTQFKLAIDNHNCGWVLLVDFLNGVRTLTTNKASSARINWNQSSTTHNYHAQTNSAIPLDRWQQQKYSTEWILRSKFSERDQIWQSMCELTHSNAIFDWFGAFCCCWWCCCWIIPSINSTWVT